MPTKAEVAEHDEKASSLFTEGERLQEAGKNKKALGNFEKIAKKYFFSQYAPEATFWTAELLLATGEPMKAFEFYQSLVDRHQSSPRFQRAVEQQYNIAVESVTAKHGSILGLVPMRPSRDRLIEMFEKVVVNAPASIYAANSQFYIARIYEGQDRHDEAIQAFQKVVDDYPRSPKAPQAQLKIAEIYEKTARRPDNPSNLRESREAYEDFITNFPQHQKKADAFAQLDVIDEKEARKSLKIAKYYQKRGETKAAAIYFKDVLRSDNAALKLEARQGIDAIGKVDSEALKMAKIDESVTRVDPAERLKNRENYLGPPAPDLVAARSGTSAGNVPLVPSEVTPAPLPLAEEPDLPADLVEGEIPSIDTGTLIPSPPPAREEDVLVPGSLLEAAAAEEALEESSTEDGGDLSLLEEENSESGSESGEKGEADEDLDESDSGESQDQ